MVNSKTNSVIAIDSIAARHFASTGAGTLVKDKQALFKALHAAEKVGPDIGGKEGQIMISIPTELVSGAFTHLEGVNPKDIQASIKRGRVENFVSREKYEAVPVVTANIVLYTQQAYRKIQTYKKKLKQGTCQKKICQQIMS